MYRSRTHGVIFARRLDPVTGYCANQSSQDSVLQVSRGILKRSEEAITIAWPAIAIRFFSCEQDLRFRNFSIILTCTYVMLINLTYCNYLHYMCGQLLWNNAWLEIERESMLVNPKWYIDCALFRVLGSHDKSPQRAAAEQYYEKDVGLLS